MDIALGLTHRKLMAYPKRTGQVTIYNAMDDANYLKGLSGSYTVWSTGPQANTTAIYVPALARNDIAFDNANSKVTALSGLDVVKTGDVVRVRGSADNDTEFTVTSGNVATEFGTSVAPTAGDAGPYITIAKQALQSNNIVLDNLTKLMWLRYGSYSPAKLGLASDGKLSWTATLVTIHAANNDLKVTTGGKGRATFTIIGGAGEVARYWPGYGYVYTAFANANAKLPGFNTLSVTANGADLDILMDTGNVTVATEAGPINGAIQLACNGVFCFAKACNTAAVGGYSDWRVANYHELDGLADLNVSRKVPNSTAFPSWPTAATIYIQTSTTLADSATSAWVWERDNYNRMGYLGKTTAGYVTLIRGGV